MMGERRVMQEALFYGFSLERHVPNDPIPAVWLCISSEASRLCRRN
jgi:hypothetical protein